jgi:hypothetical protein
MSLIAALLALIRDMWAMFFFWVLGPPVNETPGYRADSNGADLEVSVNSSTKVCSTGAVTLESHATARHGVAPIVMARAGQEDDDVSDSFLTQLEQRTQQVKITLANLEAEKVRIEGLIAQLQPFVPHYDALLAAERTLSEAAVSLDAAQPAATSAAHEPSGENGSQQDDWEAQHQAATQDTWA